MTQSPCIGLIATGDEITQGDVIDTNCPTIAQFLHDHGFTLGTQLKIPDDEAAITEGLLFLLQNHDVVIITGGLGPTSDDRTRYALSHAIEQPLQFDPASWQHIEQRLQRFGLHVHESNRQQALFPQNATILPNPNGTANGCCVQQQQQYIFLLPGPPNECLPMFEQDVLPRLLQTATHRDITHHKWRLFNVSEGEIAAQLDAELAKFECRTAYRFDYPYLEFKLQTIRNADYDSLLATVAQLVAPYLLTDNQLKASSILQQTLAQLTEPLIIDDQATGGLLQSSLVTIENYTNLCFNSFDNTHPPPLSVRIRGLKEVWQATQNTHSSQVTLDFFNHGQHQQQTFTLPYRQDRTRYSAVECIAYHIEQWLVT